MSQLIRFTVLFFLFLSNCILLEIPFDTLYKIREESLRADPSRIERKKAVAKVRNAVLLQAVRCPNNGQYLVSFFLFMGGQCTKLDCHQFDYLNRDMVTMCKDLINIDNCETQSQKMDNYRTLTLGVCSSAFRNTLFTKDDWDAD